MFCGVAMEVICLPAVVEAVHQTTLCSAWLVICYCGVQCAGLAVPRADLLSHRAAHSLGCRNARTNSPSAPGLHPAACKIHTTILSDHAFVSSEYEFAALHCTDLHYNIYEGLSNKIDCSFSSQNFYTGPHNCDRPVWLRISHVILSLIFTRKEPQHPIVHFFLLKACEARYKVKSVRWWMMVHSTSVEPIAYVSLTCNLVQVLLVSVIVIIVQTLQQSFWTQTHARGMRYADCRTAGLQSTSMT